MNEKAISYSLLFHSALLLFVAFGIPNLFEKESDFMPNAITVEIVPIGEITNLPSKPKPISKPKSAKKPKIKKPTPKVKSEPTPPEAAPKDAVAPPEELAKPEPPKERPKDTLKKEAKKAEEDELAVLLAKLKQESTQSEDPPKDDQSAEDNTSRSDYAYDDSAPLSLSERDAIRNQFIQCWRVPAGARDAHELAVNIRIKLARSGHVQEAALDPAHRSRYSSDTAFRAAADSAIRAIWKCSPLKNLPQDKYSSWSQMELNFDPKDLLY